jgi:hypothetical protein
MIIHAMNRCNDDGERSCEECCRVRQSKEELLVSVLNNAQEQRWMMMTRGQTNND